MSEKIPVPEHIAIVMDGNGRWAQKRGLPRLAGHKEGAKTAIDLMKHCKSLGVRYLTLYAFSSENWRRPSDEINGLMEILYGYLTRKEDSLIDNKVALHTIGAIDRLPEHVGAAIADLKQKTQQFSDTNLILALSYGARDEIVRATQLLAREAQSGKLAPEDITEKLFSQKLDTGAIPDPDIFIRTSGEWRLSNFLLWQLSYAELFFSDVCWPDFSPAHLDAVLLDYQKRQRRYGMTPQQLEKDML